MKISVIGCGYVGCVTGVCFADLGHEVVLVDVDLAKLRAVSAGRSPIYEPGLEDLIRKNRNRISATTDLRAAVGSTDITFVAVGTPSRIRNVAADEFTENIWYSRSNYLKMLLRLKLMKLISNSKNAWRKYDKNM